MPPSVVQFLSLRSPFFWLLFGAVFAFSLLGTYFAGVSPALALGIAFFFFSIALVQEPLSLLIFLVTVRMTLDNLSLYYQITLRETSFSLSQVLGISILFIGVLLVITYRKALAPFPLLLPLTLLILWGGVTFFYSMDSARTLQEILRLFSLLTIAFLGYVSIKNREDLRKLIVGLIFASLIPLATATVQYFLGIGLTDSSIDIARIYGTFAHTNVLALYLYTMLFLVALWWFLFGKNERNPLVLLAISSYAALAAVLLLLTYTRVAWIAAILFVFAIALWRYRLLLIPLVVFPILLTLFVPLIQERVLESFQTNPDSSLVWRRDIWHDVTTRLYYDDRQWLGTGMDTFSEYAEDLRGVRFGSTDPHNDFVKFFVEGGYVGLAIFALYWILYGRLILRLMRQKKSPEWEFFVLFGFFAGTLFLSSLTDNIHKDTPLQWLFLIVFGAALALGEKQEERLAEKV
ncbi:MAG: O-antigen ligase family protein [Candidatus Moraniibacteriota bacterium]